MPGNNFRIETEVSNLLNRRSSFLYRRRVYCRHVVIDLYTGCCERRIVTGFEGIEMLALHFLRTIAAKQLIIEIDADFGNSDSVALFAGDLE